MGGGRRSRGVGRWASGLGSRVSATRLCLGGGTLTSRDFKSLEVWRLSHALTLRIYRETADFPPSEQYGLTSQMRRSAASVPANIAEGCGRGGDAELARFLRIALGSASELEYHLILVGDLGYLALETSRQLQDDATRIKRMLSGLINTIRRRTKN